MTHDILMTDAASKFIMSISRLILSQRVSLQELPHDVHSILRRRSLSIAIS